MPTDQPNHAQLRDALRAMMAAPGDSAASLRRRRLAREYLDAHPEQRTPVDFRAWVDKRANGG